MGKRIFCGCGWRGELSQLLRAPNPFDPLDEVTACPNCKTLEGTTQHACDEPGCWKEVTCGTPTPNGYRSTCGQHNPSRRTAGQMDSIIDMVRKN
jgi:hypothetical protein